MTAAMENARAAEISHPSKDLAADADAYVTPGPCPAPGNYVTAALTLNLGSRHSPVRSTSSRRSTASHTSTKRV